VKLQLKMNYPEIQQISENTRVNLLPTMCVTNRKKFLDFGCVNSLLAQKVKYCIIFKYVVVTQFAYAVKIDWFTL
jgi:hypothetical protein